MKRAIGCGLFAFVLLLGAAAQADEEALLAWLLKDGGRARETSAGYVIQGGSSSGSATLRRTGDGFRLTDGAGRSVALRRTSTGYIAAGGGLPDGFQARETSAGYQIVTGQGARGTVRRTSAGYLVTDQNGKATVVRRTAHGLSAPSVSPRKPEPAKASR